MTEYLNWIDLQVNGNQDDNWQTAEISSDGRVILVTVIPYGVFPTRSYLYYSNDFGQTWTYDPTLNIPMGAANGFVSSDGGVWMVYNIEGTPNIYKLYLSTNRGTSWEYKDIGSVLNVGAINSDGSVILTGVANPDFYTIKLLLSTNTGGSWAEVEPLAGFKAMWYKSAMSADGSIILVGTDRFYSTSTSTVTAGLGSQTFTTQSGLPFTNGDVIRVYDVPFTIYMDGTVSSYSGTQLTINVTAKSGDGTKSNWQIFDYNGKNYLSTNTGATWSQLPLDLRVNDCCMNSDGTIILVIGYDYSASRRKFYKSTDYGANWTNIEPVNTDWWRCAVSLNGKYMLVGAVGPAGGSGGNGRLYFSPTSGATWEEIRPAGDNDKYWMCVKIGSTRSNIARGLAPGINAIVGVWSTGRIYMGRVPVGPFPTHFTT